MKNQSKNWLLASFWAFACLQGMAQVPGYLPTNGLVACYPLNGNAHDVSGYGNDGITSNVSPTTDRFFHAASAYLFPNSPAGIDCGSDTILDVNECTIAAWVRLSSTALPQQTIVARADSAATGAFELLVVEDRFRVIFYYDSTEARMDCFNILFPSTWYHLVATNSTTYGVAMYINGALSRSSPYTGNLRQGVTDHLRIGSSGAAMGSPVVNGKLDDIAIWDRVMFTEEVEAMYAAGLVARETAAPNVSFSMSPNPAVDALRLHVDASLIGERYMISNALGQEMRAGILTEQTLMIGLAGLLPGLYLVQVGHESAAKRLLIQ